MKTLKYKGATYIEATYKQIARRPYPEFVDLGEGSYEYIVELKNEKRYSFISHTLNQAWKRAWKKWGKDKVKDVYHSGKD